EDPRIRLRRFEKNAGLSAAFHAGFQAARGRIVATLDSDLQNDPHVLPALVACLDKADPAARPRLIRHDSLVKRVSSRIGNGVRRAVTGDPVQDSACSLRVMKRACLGAVLPYTGMHRFVPSLLKMAGFGGGAALRGDASVRRKPAQDGRLPRRGGAGQSSPAPVRPLEVRGEQSGADGLCRPPGRAVDDATAPAIPDRRGDPAPLLRSARRTGWPKVSWTGDTRQEDKSMTVRMIAGCLVALALVLGVGGCASMGGSSGLLDQLGGSTTLKSLTDSFVNNAASDPRSTKLLSGAHLGAREA